MKLTIVSVVFGLLLLWVLSASQDCESFFDISRGYEDSCVACISHKDEKCSWTGFACEEGPCDDDKDYPFGCVHNHCRVDGEFVCDEDAAERLDFHELCGDGRVTWCTLMDTCTDCLGWPGCIWQQRFDKQFCDDECHLDTTWPKDPDGFCVKMDDEEGDKDVDKVCSEVPEPEVDCYSHRNCVDCLNWPGCFWRTHPDGENRCHISPCAPACDCPGGRCIGLEDESAEDICSKYREIDRDYDKCATAESCDECFEVDGLEIYDKCNWFAAEYDDYEYCAPRCIRDCASDPGPYDTCERGVFTWMRLWTSLAFLLAILCGSLSCLSTFYSYSWPSIQWPRHYERWRRNLLWL